MFFQSKKKVNYLAAALRKKHQLVQTKLSKFMEMDQPSYSRIEHGGRSVNVDEWYKLCRFYNVKADELYEKAFIDNKEDIDFIAESLNSHNKKSSIHVNPKYRRELCFNVRQIYFLLDYVVTTIGFDEFLNLLDFLGVDVHAFVFMDFQFNLAFLDDLINLLLSKYTIVGSDLIQATKLFGNCSSHGYLIDDIWKLASEKSSIEFAQDFLSLTPKYNSIYETIILEKTDSKLCFQDNVKDQLITSYAKLAPATWLFLSHIRAIGLPKLITSLHEKTHLNTSEKLIGQIKKIGTYNNVYELKICG